MKIKNINIENKTVLAPMAGVNCTSFRFLCRKYNVGLLFTQMYEVETIIEKHHDGSLTEFLNIKEEESPIALQLIGSVKDDWKTAVEIAEKYVDIIDINFGCPEDEFLEKKAGSYLMKSREHIAKIAKTCVSATKKPVTAKIRSGWNNNINALEVAKILEKEGISAISVHPRTAEEHYGGKADINIIKEIKDNVSIPVIGNGDITLPGHAKSMIERTGCDAVMIGRAAMRNPEIFEYTNFLLDNGKSKGEFSKDTKNPKKLIKGFIDFYIRYENRESLNEIKDHCIWLLHQTKGAPAAKKLIRKAKTIKEIRTIIK